MEAQVILRCPQAGLSRTYGKLTKENGKEEENVNPFLL
jgi:hypothetical protein